MGRVDAAALVSEGTGLRGSWWRWLGAALSVAAVAAALHAPTLFSARDVRWQLLGAALLLAVVWTVGLRMVRPAAHVVRGWRWWRVGVGVPIAMAGAAAFAHATQILYLNWAANFDRAWMIWVVATAGIAIGLDIASGPWTRRTNRELRRGALLLGTLAVLVTIAAVYRLGNITEFPGEGTASQVEDLQTGQWGEWFQDGQGRIRWEYLSHAWLAGVGIWLGDASMLSMRVPFAIVSVLKTIPLFAWLSFSVGTVGAIVGTALYVVSAWDVVLSRIPNNQNALVVATAFALLAGPVRRGRPSAYVCLGLFGGYLWHEYVAYRPAIFLMIAGAMWLSLRDRHASWFARLTRPLLPLALVVAMGIPLFFGRLGNGLVWDEYFNGWHRARVQSPYYVATDSWRATIDKRIDRSFEALSLFYFTGDSHPARRVPQSLVDPITGTLLIIGVGAAIAHWTQPVLALTVAGLLITIAGTLVATGNFDIGRVGGAVPYVFACVGYGAASLNALARGRGRSIRMLAWGGSAVAVIWAGYLNTNALFHHWQSPSVRRALRHNLALLSGWLGQNAREDEQVVALAPGFHHVLQPNDAAWLRRREMSGVAAWDLSETLQYWANHPGKTLLVLFAGQGTQAVQRYVESLLPGIRMQFIPDPLKLDADLAFAHLDAMPPQLPSALAASRCHGLHAEFTVVDRASGAAAFTVAGIAPIVDAVAIPGELRNRLSQMESRPARVTGRYSGDVILAADGEYRFTIQVYPGSGQLLIDGKLTGSERGSRLAAGRHHIELQATFDPDPIAMVARLYWQSPSNGNTREIVPFYTISAVDPACVASLPAPAVQ